MDTIPLQQQPNHQHQNNTPTSPSPEMFSFPGTPAEPDDSDFEFGSCINPDSPIKNISDPTRTSTSPADQFFLNGRLLPHDFPVIATTSSNRSSITLSRGASIGSSSVSSGVTSSSNKDSLTSSRSNSTNSNSARTSCSDVSERRSAFRFQKRIRREQHKNVSSQRWQFIAQAPVLGPSRSMRGRKESGVGPTASTRNRKRDGSGNGNDGFLQRMLRSFIATCKACHAMECKENEFDLDGGVLGN